MVGGFLAILVACEIKVMMIKATTAAVAVAFVGVICAFAAVFVLVRRSPDPIAACIAAWAFSGISAQIPSAVTTVHLPSQS